MKNQASNLLSRVIAVFTLLLIQYNINAQVQTPKYYTSMTSLSQGYYEYLPQGYNSTSQNYPLLIYVHGLGELGDGSPSQLPRCLDAGPPMQINQGIFPSSFTVGGQNFSFIILTPQFTQWPGPDQISNIIDYAESHYRVDINRIYLTGLSMGGGVVMDYAGYYPSYSNRIAAIVPIAMANYPWAPFMQNIAEANLAVWATHNDSDNVVPVSNTIQSIDFINNSPVPPTPLAKKTIFAAYGHDAWTRTYSFSFTEGGLNVYQWMLQYKRNFTTLPVTGLEFNASKKDNGQVLLQWKTFSEINSRGFEIQRSKDGVSFDQLGFVTSKGVNGGGADYTYTDASPLDGKNYYRVKQIDNNGSVTFSTIKFVDLNRKQSVTVYPNPVEDVLNINTTGYLFNHAQLRVMDINGRVVRQQAVNSNTITVQVRGLAAGVYAGEIKENETLVRFRFVKQ